MSAPLSQDFHYISPSSINNRKPGRRLYPESNLHVWALSLWAEAGWSWSEPTVRREMCFSSEDRRKRSPWPICSLPFSLAWNHEAYILTQRQWGKKNTSDTCRACNLCGVEENWASFFKFPPGCLLMRAPLSLRRGRSDGWCASMPPSLLPNSFPVANTKLFTDLHRYRKSCWISARKTENGPERWLSRKGPCHQAWQLEYDLWQSVLSLSPVTRPANTEVVLLMSMYSFLLFLYYKNHRTWGPEFKPPSADSNTYRNQKASESYSLGSYGPINFKAISLRIQCAVPHPTLEKTLQFPSSDHCWPWWPFDRKMDKLQFTTKGEITAWNAEFLTLLNIFPQASGDVDLPPSLRWKIIRPVSCWTRWRLSIVRL